MLDKSQTGGEGRRVERDMRGRDERRRRGETEEREVCGEREIER